MPLREWYLSKKILALIKGSGNFAIQLDSITRKTEGKK